MLSESRGTGEDEMAWPRLRADGCGHHRRGGFARGVQVPGVETDPALAGANLTVSVLFVFHRVDAGAGNRGNAVWRGRS